MSAGERRLFLPCGAAALRFQRYGVFWLIPSNSPGHKRWTSPRHRGMHHCRSVFHWSNTSRNQSRTKGSTWILQRFATLLLGSSSAGAAAGVGERAAQGLQEEAISSCVSGRAMASPGCHQSGRCGHHAEAHGGRGCAPEEHFSHSCCLLERPRDRRRLSGGQLKPTDRAMAARSVRTSSSEDESRSADEDERLLTKRCIERENTVLEQNTCLRVETLP